MTLSRKILRWYKQNHQQYPWRETSNPYHIWLSEIMLQQTQAKTVIPYYNKWLKIFPSITSVAKAPLDTILKAWEGLGYYARARNFHKACIMLHEKNINTVPNTLNDFIKLPGVGEYTAAAVLSIAYKQPLPAIDTNVIRVFSRIKEVRALFPKSKKIIFKYVQNDFLHKSPGDYNQAMMDFGRFICTNGQPKCNMCVINKFCNAFVNNSVNKFPLKIKKVKKPHHHVAVGVIWKNNKILITKRPNAGLLGGLWELPGGKILPNEQPQHCVAREIKEELNLEVSVQKKLHQIQHAYSHFSISLSAYKCKLIKGAPKLIGCVDYRWIKPEDVNKFAFPKANHKLFNKIYD
tara:strand:+ start:40 stop:1086 length:1047 start_codon:yes stop_codon:yes gene_type:complete